MYKIQITQEQKSYAWAIVQRTPIAKRGVNDGGMKHKFGGVLGEIVMCDVMGLERKKWQDYEKFDNGVDFEFSGKKIDLKVLLMKAPFRDFYVNNLMASQLSNQKNETEIYLFSVINTLDSTMQFNGWIRKSMIKNEWLIPKGTPRPRGKFDPLILPNDTFEIPNRFLEEFNPRTFESALAMFSLT